MFALTKVDDLFLRKAYASRRLEMLNFISDLERAEKYAKNTVVVVLSIHTHEDQDDENDVLVMTPDGKTGYVYQHTIDLL